MSAASRSLPYDEGIESGLIGAALGNPDLADEIIAATNPSAFYCANHRTVFETIVAMKDAAVPVNLLTVQNRLTELGLIEITGGVGTLASNYSENLPPSFTAHYVEQLHNYWQLRELYARCQAGSEKVITEGGIEPGALIDEIEQSIYGVRDLRGKDDNIVSAKEAMLAATALFKRLWTDPDFMDGLATGYPDIDHLLSGLKAAEHIVIAARPSVGKTAFLLNLIENISVNQGKPSLVFSLEMPVAQLTFRLAAQRAGIDLKRLRNRSLKEADFFRLEKAAMEIAKAPIFFDDSGENTIQGIRSTARRLKRREGIELVAVDYIQLINTTTKHDRREAEVAEVSKLSKGGAKELCIPWLSLCQLNRNFENRGSGEPKLYDLRESGAIEQDADVVAFLTRPTTPDGVEFEGSIIDNSDERSKAKLIIGKNRNGPTGMVPLHFHEKFTRFDSVARTGQQQQEDRNKKPAAPLATPEDQTQNDQDEDEGLF